MKVRFSAQTRIARNGKCHDGSCATLSRPVKYESLVKRALFDVGGISLIEEDDSQHSSMSAERKRY